MNERLSRRGRQQQRCAHLLPIILSISVVLTLAETAAAQETASEPFEVKTWSELVPLYGGHDWYMSVAPVVAISNGDTDGADPGGGGSLAMGFRFNRWVTAEFGAEWIKRIRYDRGGGPLSCTGDVKASNGHNAYTITVGGRLYATESRIQPYLVGHGGLIQTRDFGGGKACKETGFVGRMGAGVEIFMDETIALNLSAIYVLPVGGPADHDYLSIAIGLTWY